MKPFDINIQVIKEFYRINISKGNNFQTVNCSDSHNMGPILILIYLV